MAVEITTGRLGLAALRMAELTKETKFILIGRGTLAVTAPIHLRTLAVSDDIDLWPLDDEKAALDESIELCGEGSEFHREHGFYVERLGSWTMMTQPKGWEERATEVRFGEVSLLVLGLLDLAYNKLEANREKDREFLKEALDAGLLNRVEVGDFVKKHAPKAVRGEILANLESLG